MSLTIVTRISRAAAAAGAPAEATERTVAEGTIAISGDTRTEMAGTTSRSMRFSPLNTSLPSRYCTGSVSTMSSPPGRASVSVAVNGVGRNGRPNGASASKV